MALKENSLNILNYLKDNADKQLTCDDVAEALGLNKRSVVGSFNSFVKKGLGVRVDGEVETADGVKAVKFLTLTAAGLAYDPAADVAE